MKHVRIVAAAAALFLSTSAQAVVIVGLYNTGVNSGGTGFGVGGGVTAGNGADPHWTMVANTGTAPSGAFNGGTNGSFPLNGPWAAEDAVSRWLTSTSNAGDSFDPSVAGDYTYRISFDLTGYDPATASFSGRLLSDNRVLGISLNGGSSFGSGVGFGATEWDAFSTSSGFVSGVNNLDFLLRNDAAASGNPLGLRVEFTASDVSAIPEPATWAMMIGGFALVGGMIRRRRSSRGWIAATA